MVSFISGGFDDDFGKMVIENNTMKKSASRDSLDNLE